MTCNASMVKEHKHRDIDLNLKPITPIFKNLTKDIFDSGIGTR